MNTLPSLHRRGMDFSSIINHLCMVPFMLVYGTSECSTSSIYYNECSRITLIYDTHDCYVCIKINIRDTLFIHGTFPPSACASFVYDHCICSVSSMILEVSKYIQRVIWQQKKSNIQHACN